MSKNFFKSPRRAGGALLILALVLALVSAAAAPVAVMAASNADKKVVVVDAGHGGDDAGVCGVRTGVKESELNLKVAKLLAEYLKAGGFKVVMTRHNDTAHRFKGVDNKKRADMFKRGEIINRAKPAAIVSIHMNFYSSASRRGAQTFFDVSNDESKRLAECLQDVLNRRINPDLGGRSYACLKAEKYLLSCSPYPAVIAECGFLSNPFDEANLIKPEFQSRLAYALFEGIAIFLQGEEAA